MKNIQSDCRQPKSDSNLQAMASNLRAMASNLLAFSILFTSWKRCFLSKLTWVSPSTLHSSRQRSRHTSRALFEVPCGEQWRRTRLWTGNGKEQNIKNKVLKHLETETLKGVAFFRPLITHPFLVPSFICSSLETTSKQLPGYLHYLTPN